MLSSVHQLVGRNFLDGLFRGVPLPQTQEARRLCQGLGYDPDHPHAFYPASVALACANLLGELLFPTGTRGRQQYELGKVAAQGYAQTVPGRMAAVRRPHQPLAVVHYYIPLLHRGLPPTNASALQGGADSCTVEVRGFPLHPAFFSGNLSQFVTDAVHSEPDCRYEVVSAGQYRFTVNWQPGAQRGAAASPSEGDLGTAGFLGHGAVSV